MDCDKVREVSDLPHCFRPVYLQSFRYKIRMYLLMHLEIECSQNLPKSCTALIRKIGMQGICPCSPQWVAQDWGS